MDATQHVGRDARTAFKDRRLKEAIRTVLVLGTALCLTGGCRGEGEDARFSVKQKNGYPTAVDPAKVGTYPALTRSGGGYFYDDVLEYRVWVHPRNKGDDNYHAFATFEEASAFSRNTDGAESPLVLVLQREWIDEPKPGEFRHKKGVRITEWQVEWLKGSKRGADSIARFMAARTATQGKSDRQRLATE
jgi:hypothetical protein